MSLPQIVIDANVITAALRSQHGASFKLLSLVGTNQFEVHDSVALVLEYEDAFERVREGLGLSQDEIATFIDSLCAMARHHKIYFLWRPFLSNVNDELILELAVSARCGYIVTHKVGRFSGSEKYGTRAITPRAFLQLIGEERA